MSSRVDNYWELPLQVVHQSKYNGGFRAKRKVSLFMPLYFEYSLTIYITNSKECYIVFCRTTSAQTSSQSSGLKIHGQAINKTTHRKKMIKEILAINPHKKKRSICQQASWPQLAQLRRNLVSLFAQCHSHYRPPLTMQRTRSAPPSALAKRLFKGSAAKVRDDRFNTANNLATRDQLRFSASECYSSVSLLTSHNTTPALQMHPANLQRLFISIILFPPHFPHLRNKFARLILTIPHPLEKCDAKATISTCPPVDFSATHFPIHAPTTGSFTKKNKVGSHNNAGTSSKDHIRYYLTDKILRIHHSDKLYLFTMNATTVRHINMEKLSSAGYKPPYSTSNTRKRENNECNRVSRIG
uniref:Uncharacterized protein n=1 Tax=Oryza brachyantha TaxID=4533 RepID=J3MEL9_ORYBR